MLNNGCDVIEIINLMQLPDYPTAKEYFISPQGLQNLLSAPRDPSLPGQNVIWTTDFKTQLPIRLATSGVAATRPTTLIEQFRKAVHTHRQRSALSTKINGAWFTYSYPQYYEECVKFAKALLAYKMDEHTAINIIGFNAPEWFFAFYGSLLARCIPIGVYTTNNLQTCEYIATHSEAKMVLAQNRQYASKYYHLLDTGAISLIVIYNDPSYVPEKHADKIITYNRFVIEGERVDAKFVEQRVQKVKPGHCCTLVYTSGTTGMPKGVMLSHDNYVFTKKSLDQFHERDRSIIHRCVSFLPLSHVAAQFSDIVGSMMEGVHVFFADPSALQGTLIQTLQDVRPTFFFSVPRVWQKIYDKMMEMAKTNGWLKTKIATWAKGIGAQGTGLERHKQQTSIQFKLAKLLVFNNVKKALGLDQCQFFFYGAAPLDPTIRRYFLTLNFFLINSYGMSQSTGPQNMSDMTSLDVHGPLQGFREVGRNLPGTDIIILKSNPKEQDGQICYRGRNTFMGYFKNPQQTASTIDAQGFLHSGDTGKITKDGILFITGRAKQLIITAGGENVPPVLIENEIRAALPFLANVMVLGDMRKYLTCLVTLKEDPPASGNLDTLSKQYLADRGCKGTTIKEVVKDEKLRKIVSDGLKKANEKAISRAQFVQDFAILEEDFSVQNGLLTPTLKLKRKEVVKKYEKEIESLYNKPSL